jgi:hypothetical protein
MSRVKVSDNFYLDEFIHPVIYKRFKGNSKLYLSQDLVNLVQAIREKYGKPIFINTWFNGGSLKNSGLRDYKNPLGSRLNRSRHYYGLCADLHAKDIKELQRHVIDNKEFYHDKGLRVVEDFNFTASWCHISVEWTGLQEIKIIKP